MIKPMKLSELLAPLNAELHGDDASFERVNTDTRSVQAGDLFVAIKGERFDAHSFVADACKSGAVAAVVERLDDQLAAPQLLVKDTTRALGDIAHQGRMQFQGPLIALTGSSGKTTVKEMIATVLGQAAPVHVTRGNLNNHIGVPQTLLAMQGDAQYAVIEMGASGLGEIDYLASLAEPTVALVNNVMAAHLQGFGSEAGVAAEKSTIYRHLRQGGTAVINLDESYASGWMDTLKAERSDVQFLTFSVADANADIFATDIQLTEKACYEFTLHAGEKVAGQKGLGEKSIAVNLPMMGRQNVNNALAVASCCLAVGASLKEIAEGLTKVAPVKGRMMPQSGMNGSLVIDDTYNANPGSVKAAAQLLMDLKHQGRDVLLVLGDLGELGDGELGALTALGQTLKSLGVPALITQGKNSQYATDGFNECDALNKGQTTSEKECTSQEQTAKHFVSKDELNHYLFTQLTDNTVVLVKGSRSASMESVVQAITLGGEQQ
ncbi:UDP-N-acetylmuramoyl-tripeptide--D-alanyl-D-alanine ligase [Pseudomaricurvus sp.]|uniref:UDP-N-acetylmuramoyl-tripeptide--D-alanyl-D- alanine ligase n=1 Tax=Pseudomaricurvus sp. TaxID=2004510 RepID=UPI003F6C5233